MKKLKLYLDTSVISHLFADDTPDKMQDTNQLWSELICGKYAVYISSVVTDELEQCSEPKLSQMYQRLSEIHYTKLEQTEEATQLASEYLRNDVLKEKSLADCFHIAYAVTSNCDVIVSWNFKHLVNYTTIKKVKVVNAILHYKEISIMSPTMLIEGVD